MIRPTSAATMARIANIDKHMENMQRHADLMKPLVIHLMPIRHERLKAGAVRDDMWIELYVEDWREQYDEGINRCVGINILWQRKPVEDTFTYAVEGMGYFMRVSKVAPGDEVWFMQNGRLVGKLIEVVKEGAGVGSMGKAGNVHESEGG